MGAGASINEADQKSLTDELAKPVDASDVATPRGETARAEVVRLRAMLPGLAKPVGEAGATAAAGEAVAGEGAAAAAPAAGGPAVKYVTTWRDVHGLELCSKGPLRHPHITLLCQPHAYAPLARCSSTCTNLTAFLCLPPGCRYVETSLQDISAAIDAAVAAGLTPLVVDNSKDAKYDTFMSYQTAQIIDAKMAGLSTSAKVRRGQAGGV